MASDYFNTGQANISNAANQGKDAIGSFDPNAWQQQTAGGLNNLWNQQNSTQNAYTQAFKNQISSQPSATDYYNQGNQLFNVQGLQQTSNNLNNAMLQAPNSNLNAARGFNVDQNQVDQKTSQDLQRLAPSAQAAQNNATTAQGNAMNFANMGMQQNNMNLLPMEQQGQYLMDSYARQQSGFTAVQQSQLQALQAKMQAGVQLSSQEMAQYSALTQSEQSYQASLNNANTSMNVAKLNNQYIPVGNNQNLVNTFKNTIMNPAMLTSQTGVARYG